MFHWYGSILCLGCLRLDDWIIYLKIENLEHDRWLGSEYAGFIADFHITGYSIDNMEVISATNSEVTLHYVIRTQVEDANAAALFTIFLLHFP